MNHALPLLLLCAAAQAVEVAQFRAEDFGANWRATRRGAVLRAVHPATNGWGAAFAGRGGVSFAGTNGVASPLEFDPATTDAVARVLIVADCAEARPWSALLDAPSGATLTPRAFAWEVVRLSVSSSRHAALSWGTDESLLLPPCTNLTLRLRLSADDIKTVALSPSPNASTNPVGTWRAALVADWDARRGFPTEGDRVALADGTMVDRSEQESVSAQAWMPSPALRSGGPNRAGGGRRKPEISFTPRWVCLLVENDSFCSIHGPAPTVRVFAENAEPPYVWTERGVSTTTQTDSFTPSNPYPDGHYEFSVMWPDSHEVLFVQAPIRLDPITCRSGRTNLVGAAWSSTHNPTNAADHAPGIAEETVSFGPNCPVAHDVNLIRGYKHSPPPDIRNLVRIVTGNLQDDDTDHCLGLVWSTNLVINLDDYLDSSSEQCGGNLYFELETDATVSFVSNSITVPREPADLNPVIIHALLRIPNESRPADRLWIVVNSRETKKQFDDWYDHNSTNLSWIATLPRPPATISLDTNGDPLPLESPYNSSWSNPERVNQTSFMHHDAVYEIRTNINAIPGNQATYDREGRLIQTGIAAGTADSYGPYTSHGVPWPNMRHYYRDVEPFIRAVQLDGNPIRAGLRSFNRPCLFQGQHIEKYIFCRPTSHP